MAESKVPNGVSNPAYRKALNEFSTYFQQVHRTAGDPTYSEVSRRLRVSPATVHRYLNGVILPRWQFVADYLKAFEAEMGFTPMVMRDEREKELKERWMAARNILKPIGYGEAA